MKHYLYSFIADIYQYIIFKKHIKTNDYQMVLFCPHGLGDTYYTCAFLSIFTKKNPQITVLLVIKKTHLGIAKLFNLTNTRILTGWVPRVPFMVLHRLLFGIPKLTSSKQILFANPLFLNVGEHNDKFGQSNHAMASIFKGMFNLPQTTQIPCPKISQQSRRDAKQIFAKYKYDPRRTIVIAPEANSIAEIDNLFWDKLVVKLKKNNYSVIIIGNKYKHKFAINLLFNLSYPKKTNDLLAFLDLSKALISLRSGLCDITIASHIKRIIIYPVVKRGDSTFYECYNLKNQIPSKYLKEIIYLPTQRNKIITQIMDSIKK